MGQFMSYQAVAFCAAGIVHTGVEEDITADGKSLSAECLGHPGRILIRMDAHIAQIEHQGAFHTGAGLIVKRAAGAKFILNHRFNVGHEVVADADLLGGRVHDMAVRAGAALGHQTPGCPVANRTLQHRHIAGAPVIRTGNNISQTAALHRAGIPVLLA